MTFTTKMTPEGLARLKALERDVTDMRTADWFLESLLLQGSDGGSRADDYGLLMLLARRASPHVASLGFDAAARNAVLPTRLPAGTPRQPDDAHHAAVAPRAVGVMPIAAIAAARTVRDAHHAGAVRVVVADGHRARARRPQTRRCPSRRRGSRTTAMGIASPVARDQKMSSST